MLMLIGVPPSKTAVTFINQTSEGDREREEEMELED